MASYSQKRPGKTTPEWVASWQATHPHWKMMEQRFDHEPTSRELEALSLKHGCADISVEPPAAIDGCAVCGTEDVGRFAPARSENVCRDCLDAPSEAPPAGPTRAEVLRRVRERVEEDSDAYADVDLLVSL